MKKTLITILLVLLTATLFVACSSSPKEEAEKPYLMKYDNGETVLYVAKDAFTKQIPYFNSSVFKLYSDAECTQEIASDAVLTLTMQGTEQVISFGEMYIGKIADIRVAVTANQKKKDLTSYTLSFSKGEYNTVDSNQKSISFEVTEDFSCEVEESPE